MSEANNRARSARLFGATFLKVAVKKKNKMLLAVPFSKRYELFAYFFPKSKSFLTKKKFGGANGGEIELKTSLIGASRRKVKLVLARLHRYEHRYGDWSEFSSKCGREKVNMRW